MAKNPIVSMMGVVYSVEERSTFVFRHEVNGIKVHDVPVGVVVRSSEGIVRAVEDFLPHAVSGDFWFGLQKSILLYRGLSSALADVCRVAVCACICSWGFLTEPIGSAAFTV